MSYKRTPITSRTLGRYVRICGVVNNWHKAHLRYLISEQQPVFYINRVGILTVVSDASWESVLLTSSVRGFKKYKLIVDAYHASLARAYNFSPTKKGKCKK